MTTPKTPERPVDLMMDLRERMVRIETKLDVRTVKDLEVDHALEGLRSRATAIETASVILKTQVATLRWVGTAAVAFLAFFGSSLTQLLSLLK